MDAKIDWVSFTMPVSEAFKIISIDTLEKAAIHTLKKISGGHYDYIYRQSSFGTTAGRAPYRYSLARDDGGVRIYGGGSSETILFELSGRACEGLRDKASYTNFLSPVVGHLTRLDLAFDILTDVSPDEFCHDRTHSAFRSSGRMASPTGTTCYIGSARSDRFARVYRYSKPHPRHRLLRCEHVFRRTLARDAAKNLLKSASVLEFGERIGATWGWSHPVWAESIQNSEKLTTNVANRSSDKTVSWLYGQVAPALRRVMASGDLNLTDFLEFVLNPQEHSG